MKLYLVHCGFYDADLCGGVYESHVNFFVAADDFTEARESAKKRPDFIRKKMHVDGLQEVNVVDGYRVRLSPDAGLAGKTEIVSSRHRDLAPKGPA